jgi:diaminopimelate decarboxylase
MVTGGERTDPRIGLARCFRIMIDHIKRLVKECYPASGNELICGGVAASEIARQYGTPLFVYDGGVLDCKWRILRDALPAEFHISYSVKANPNGAILRHFLAKGCGLEIASAGEFYQARRAGCLPENIVFAGPGKTEAELELVVAEGIGEIHVESLLEIQRVAAICRRLQRKTRVAVRVNPAAETQGGAMRMGGKPAPFGIDEEMIDPALEELLAHPELDLCGVHLFTGTQILDHSIVITHYRKGLEIAKRIAGRLGHPIRTIDFGGGFGIPYFANEHPLDMGKLRQGLEGLLDEVRSAHWLSGGQLMVEPGRYLVGEAGIYIVRVIDIKVSKGRTFLITDGGMHHHLAASGNLGQTIKRNYPLALLNRLAEPAGETVEVVGSLCTPLDVLARSITLPKAEVGDLVGVFQSGAYGRSASPMGFLSHLSPPEVWVEQGSHYLIRRRGEYADYLRDVVVPHDS